MELPGVLTYAGSWVAVTGGIWFVFERAETVISTEGKAMLTGWLKNLGAGGKLSNWPQGFAEIFDSVFGRKHLSWRCFARSSIASFISVAVLTLIWLAFSPASARYHLRLWDMKELITLALILNVLPDYLSLLKARYVVRAMARKPTVGRITFLLILDFVACVAIYFAFFVAFWWSYVVWYRSPTVFLGDLQDFVAVSLSFRTPVSSLFFATFFTSVWAWLYALSVALVRGANYFSVGVKTLERFLDIDDKPIRSLGLVSMLIVTVLYLVVPLFR